MRGKKVNRKGGNQEINIIRNNSNSHLSNLKMTIYFGLYNLKLRKISISWVTVVKANEYWMQPFPKLMQNHSQEWILCSSNFLGFFLGFLFLACINDIA